MKTTIIALLAMLLLSMVVIASEDSEPNLISEQNKVDKIDRLAGIANAITRGNKSEETIQKLTEVLNKIEDKRLEVIQKLEDLKIDMNKTKDKVLIEGEKEGKFLGLFKARHTEMYEVSEDGSVKEKGWFKWLWKD